MSKVPSPSVLGSELSSYVLIIRAGRVLLVQRSEKSSNGLLWECPGGKVEDFFTIKAETLREAFEETGYNVTLVDSLGWHSGEHQKTRRHKRINVMTMFWVARIATGSLTLSTEHATAQWCTYDEALALELTPILRAVLIQYRSKLMRQFKLRRSR